MGLGCNDKMSCLMFRGFLSVFWFTGPLCNSDSFAGVGTTGSALDEDGVLEIDTTVSLETTWHAMEELVSMGLVRSIGIRYACNFENFRYNLAGTVKFHTRTIYHIL